MCNEMKFCEAAGNTPRSSRSSAAVQAKLRGLFVEPIPGTPEGIKKRGEAEAALWDR